MKDPYHGLGGVIGRDGSFSRSYIALKTYENAAYGRQFTTDIACLNEWAVETGAGGMRGREMQRMRKRPYLIGKIECQLLFVPSLNPSEELPKSMSAAVREMKNAEWFSQLLWEGYLSQQGGDCQVSNPHLMILIIALETTIFQTCWCFVDRVSRIYGSSTSND